MILLSIIGMGAAIVCKSPGQIVKYNEYKLLFDFNLLKIYNIIVKRRR